eukprot:CAMPEP_0174988214 /NCGR_PEP_ID=MMETSP0004_2-20121128/19992_1 /TAXON_ID=420556 /ORGANISM="Ochromonas sp., Strain CCMP1393" /LENGTH=94 /DNA_ID=CAMNT_0016241387 /DNA_START=220 /DNA_END=504 /DNA_ORIENTATION=-
MYWTILSTPVPTAATVPVVPDSSTTASDAVSRPATCAKMTGPVPLMSAASLCMTSREAPTAGAKSILFITSRSDWVIPGPPLRGTLSPPAVSMT